MIPPSYRSTMKEKAGTVVAVDDSTREVRLAEDWGTELLSCDREEDIVMGRTAFPMLAEQDTGLSLRIV
jgi:hypothetical protein